MTKDTEPNGKGEFSIHPDTAIGAVSVTVASLEDQIGFYQEALGFQVRRQEGSRVYLGTSQKDLLELVEDPIATRYRRTTGLYHFALLYPDRRELARAIARLYALQVPNYPTDHIMTKTTYLDDLEGNGIELYCESPEDGAWSLKNGEYITRRADGSLSSGREPLDVEALFGNLREVDRLDQPLPETARLGHVHLHVRDLEESMDFYHGVLGFDDMGIAESVGMGFVSAGGYHHHIGFNIWQGKGAPAPPEASLGLRYFTVSLPDRFALEQVVDRIQQSGIPPEETESGILLHDPSQNGVLLASLA
ncbi:MAG: VOC family protein [Anaerolineales bacterium]